MMSVVSSMIASSQSALAFARPVPATPALWCDSSERRHHHQALPSSGFTERIVHHERISGHMDWPDDMSLLATLPGTMTIIAKDCTPRCGKKRNEEKAAHGRFSSTLSMFPGALFGKILEFGRRSYTEGPG